MRNEESGPTDVPEQTTTEDEDNLSETGKVAKNFYTHMLHHYFRMSLALKWVYILKSLETIYRI